MPIDGVGDGLPDAPVIEGRTLRVHVQLERPVIWPLNDAVAFLPLELPRRGDRLPGKARLVDVARQQRQGGVRHLDKDELIDGRLAEEEIGVGVIDVAPLLLAVLAEPKEATPDDGCGVALLHGILYRRPDVRRDDGHRAEQVREHPRGRFGEADGDVGAVRRGLGRGHALQRPAPGDHALLQGLLQVAVGKGDVVGGERLPVVPGHPLAQAERPGDAILRHGPFLGQPGHVTLRVLPDQRVEQVGHAHVTRAPGVHGKGRGVAPVIPGDDPGDGLAIGHGRPTRRRRSGRGSVARDVRRARRGHDGHQQQHDGEDHSSMGAHFASWMQRTRHHGARRVYSGP